MGGALRKRKAPLFSAAGLAPAAEILYVSRKTTFLNVVFLLFFFVFFEHAENCKKSIAKMKNFEKIFCAKKALLTIFFTKNIRHNTTRHDGTKCQFYR